MKNYRFITQREFNCFFVYIHSDIYLIWCAFVLNAKPNRRDTNRNEIWKFKWIWLMLQRGWDNEWLTACKYVECTKIADWIQMDCWTCVWMNLLIERRVYLKVPLPCVWLQTSQKSKFVQWHTVHQITMLRKWNSIFFKKKINI